MNNLTRDKLYEQRDILLRALEMIAVGDSREPKRDAEYALIAAGIWNEGETNEL